MIEFLGRAAELVAIRESLGSWGQRHVLAISGPGGIGKTRLLHEIERANRARARMRFLDVIDFDLPIYEIPQIVWYTIARQFPAGTFTAYLEALHLRQIAEEGGIDPIRLLPQMLDATRAFVECFNRAAAQERVIVRFDTVEKLQGRLHLSTLIRMLLQLENMVAIFAGRRQPDGTGDGLDALLRELEQHNSGQAIVKHVLLAPLDAPTFQVYVDKKQTMVGLNLDPQWRNTLAILAGGYPIRIDLAVELGNQLVAADWLRELKRQSQRLAALRQSATPASRTKFEAIQQRFDQELVAGIIDIRNDLDRLKVLLALIAPLNTQSIADILRMSHAQARALFEEASQSVSFKIVDTNLISLHDTVRELLLQYVLPELDPDHEREHTYIERAIDSFEQQAREILVRMRHLRSEEDTARAANDREHALRLFEERAGYQRLYQQCSLRIVECAFRLDSIGGAERLEQTLQVAGQHGIFSTDLQALFDLVQPYLAQLEHQSARHYIRVQILIAEQYILDGQYAQAEAICTTIESRITGSTPLRFEILDHYGDIQMGIGKAQAALGHYQKAVELARQLHDDWLIIKALLSSGWAARVLGQLDAAIHYYQQAFALTFKTRAAEHDLLIQRARALNGLAYVYAIQNKRRTAADTLNQAIDIRRRLGDSGRFALAQSYTTAGEIYTDLELPREALNYLTLAEDLFAELGQGDRLSGRSPIAQYSQWAGKIASARGRAYWALAGMAEDSGEQQERLDRAEVELTHALDLAIAADVPRARYRLGNVYSADPRRRALAVATWQQSYQAARDIGDIFTELNSVSQLARMAVYSLETGYGSYQDFATWLEQYHQRNHGTQFHIVESCFAIYRGCLALQVGDIETALDCYRQGLGVLVEQPKQSIYSFDWQLRFLEHDVLPTCAPAAVREVWSRLLDHWIEMGKGVEAWTTFQRWQHWPS